MINWGPLDTESGQEKLINRPVLLRALRNLQGRTLCCCQDWKAMKTHEALNVYNLELWKLTISSEFYVSPACGSMRSNLFHHHGLFCVYLHSSRVRTRKSRGSNEQLGRITALKGHRGSHDKAFETFYPQTRTLYIWRLQITDSPRSRLLWGSINRGKFQVTANVDNRTQCALFVRDGWKQSCAQFQHWTPGIALITTLREEADTKTSN